MSLFCRVPGCEKAIACRQMCWAHYQRWLRYGHPQGRPAHRDPLAGMWERVIRRDDGCWWFDSLDKRPPRWMRDGHRLLVRRLIWEAEVRPLKKGERLAPCPASPYCVRPDHQVMVSARTEAA